MGILAFLGVYLFMDKDSGGRQRPFDFLGFIAVVTFVGAFQLMSDRGPSQDWFGSREIWIEGMIGVVGLYVLVVQTLSAPHPFFPRALARDRNFVTSTFFTLFVGVLLFSTSALLPQLMQNLLGYSALQSGMASAPRGIGSFIGFLFVPAVVNRLGARPVLLIGVVVSAWSLWQMAHFDLSMTARSIQVAGFIQGVGVGFLFAPLNVVSYATLDPELRTEGAVVGTMVRSLGSSLGISVLQASLSARRRHRPRASGGEVRARQPGERPHGGALTRPDRRPGRPQWRGDPPSDHARLQCCIRLDGAADPATHPSIGDDESP